MVLSTPPTKHWFPSELHSTAVTGQSRSSSNSATGSFPSNAKSQTRAIPSSPPVNTSSRPPEIVTDIEFKGP